MPAERIQDLKHIGDMAAVGVTVGSLAQWLPPLAALVTIVWTLIRIYETDTVQKWLHKD